MCVHTPNMYMPVPLEIRKRHLNLLELELGTTECLLRSNLGPLQEQQVLLTTEPSLWP